MKIQNFRDKQKKITIYVLGIIIFTMIACEVNNSFAKFQTKESVNVVKGTINYKPYDFKVMAMYEKDAISEYKEINYMPTIDYKINEEKSYCTLDNINKDSEAKFYTNEYGEHVMTGLKKNSKCYVYFDKNLCPNNSLACKNILANKTISTRTDFTTTLESATIGTIYAAYDDDGISYYYAGSPTDNWVNFAGFYWRIIRINGDGTLRLIYNGTTTETIGEGTVALKNTTFNKLSNDNAYVGYIYTLNEIHGLGTSSNIKIELDKWYLNNLVNYESYIDENAGFCSDRNSYLDYAIEGGGIGTIKTYYNSFMRIVMDKKPSLKCNNPIDLYTRTNASKGNKILTNSIGLLTADEVVYAGGVIGLNNKKYYLYNNLYTWTISPSDYNPTFENAAHVFAITSNGELNGNYVNSLNVVRPVINLRADILFNTNSNGTIENPYVVQ